MSVKSTPQIPTIVTPLKEGREELQNITVEAIYIYPIKSCRGIELKKARVDQYGFELDRIWVIADPTGQQFTQRSHPRMALISTSILQNPSTSPSQPAYERGGTLTLSTPSMPSISIPFPTKTTELSEVKVWENNLRAYNEGTEVEQWLTKFLETPCALYGKDMTQLRPLAALHTPSSDHFINYTPQTGFADAFPFLLLSTASLNSLNSRLPSTCQKATAKNFRPNIMISTPNSPAFVEDTFLSFSILSETSETKFYVANRCTRCILPSTNPETGIRDQEPIVKTLMSYRRVDPGQKNKSCFGVNLVQETAGGMVRVGDCVKVTRTGVHDLRGIWNTKEDETLDVAKPTMRRRSVSLGSGLNLNPGPQTEVVKVWRVDGLFRIWGWLVGAVKRWLMF